MVELDPDRQTDRSGRFVNLCRRRKTILSASICIVLFSIRIKIWSLAFREVHRTGLYEFETHEQKTQRRNAING